MPQRFIQPFVDTGLDNSAHLIGSHPHADFASGNREIARQTGAAINAGGNRSMSVIPALKRRGRRNVIRAEGGINMWRMRGYEMTKENPSHIRP